MTRYLVGACVFVLLLIALVVTQQARISGLQQAFVAKQAEAVIWRDKAGRSNAEVATLRLTLRDAKQTQGELLDSLRRITGIHPRHTASITTVVKHTRDTIVFPISKPRFQNEWLHFEWIDSARLAFMIRDSVLLVGHRRRHGFLGLRETYVARVVSFNPYTTITGLQSLEFAPPRRRLTVGLHAGYGLQFGGNAVTAGWNVGIGLNYKLF